VVIARRPRRRAPQSRKHTLSINGKTYTKPQVLALIAQLEKPYDDATKAHVTLTNLVEVRDATATDVLDFATGYAGEGRVRPLDERAVPAAPIVAG